MYTPRGNGRSALECEECQQHAVCEWTYQELRGAVKCEVKISQIYSSYKRLRKY